MRTGITVLAAALIAGPAIAQSTYETSLQTSGGAVAATPASPANPAQQAPIANGVVMQSQTENILRSGTPVPLKMREMLTTKGKDLRVGQRFQMEVSEPVVVNGVIVIPAGSPAVGEVTDVRNKGMWGKSGKINARPLFVRANGRQIRLTGQMDDKGVTGTAAVVGAVVLLPLAGFFMTGTSAEIPIGAPVSAFVDEDVAFSVSTSATPAPMAVPSTPQQ